MQEHQLVHLCGVWVRRMADIYTVVPMVAPLARTTPNSGQLDPILGKQMVHACKRDYHDWTSSLHSLTAAVRRLDKRVKTLESILQPETKLIRLANHIPRLCQTHSSS